MSNRPDALWLNVSPILEKLDRPLLNALSRHITISGSIARPQMNPCLYK
jgi:hypothetical protein